MDRSQRSGETQGPTEGVEGRQGINAYATLLTRPSYLAGALLLAYTLYKHSPDTPLVLLYTPDTLPETCVEALRIEAKYSGCIVYPVGHLRLPRGGDGEGGGGMVAERFADTWTKLRVFEVLDIEVEVQGVLVKKKVDRLCFLDADMMVFSNPSPLIFNADNDAFLHPLLPSSSTGAKADHNDQGNIMRLCATHTCVCNLDFDPWAPASWTPANCAYTRLTHPCQLAPVCPSSPTLGNFNSGTFVFRPSLALRSHVLGAFHSTPPAELRKLKFPDQDFLNTLFEGRWKSLSWCVNALKTWRYWHANIWRDGEVKVLHYIVDKPWAARVGVGEGRRKVAGYKGDDGVTHGWWWEKYGAWVGERRARGETEMVATVEEFVAGESGAGSEELYAVGGKAQDFAKRWEGNATMEKKGEDEKKEGRVAERKDGQVDGDRVKDEQIPSHGPVLRKKMLGERGHGPVVRGQGRSFMDP
ncbi:glycosyltransferase family 8 protein [Lentithecium fluviatile CBS 122367]|uniref:Glycosyltransferase family 8 protein n=1 Tax=Lentithecium fluviatile CBS 122367 TaxID=1168545 RepID=A0A6G1IN37_9PLEO|nr:glycosyltransferase family 8 protein [Lentithecium fluviatile CBS 122367]